MTQVTIAIFEREDDGATSDAVFEETAYGGTTNECADLIGRGVADFLTNNADENVVYEATIEVLS